MVSPSSSAREKMPITVGYGWSHASRGGGARASEPGAGHLCFLRMERCANLARSREGNSDRGDMPYVKMDFATS
jgi:hypothetical protein